MDIFNGQKTNKHRICNEYSYTLNAQKIKMDPQFVHVL